MKRLVAIVIAVVALGVAPAALALSGSYRTKVTNNPMVNGTYKVTFSPGHYKVEVNGHSIGGGMDKVVGHTITFLNGTMCGRGTYKFKLGGRKLTFTKISDSCVGREIVLSHVLHKVG